MRAPAPAVAVAAAVAAAVAFAVSGTPQARAQDAPGASAGKPAEGPRDGDLEERLDRMAEEEKGRAAEEGRRPFIQVNEIVVSADRGVPLAYPGGRDVIEPETLRRYPDANLETVVRRVPGVYVIPESGNDGSINLGIRGNDPRRSALVTILVNGVPMKEAPYGNTDADILPITMERVHRIDVIRGGASIRYGPNSAGGIVNLITEPIPEGNLARVTTRFGSDRDASVAATLGGTWHGLGALVTMVRKSGDGFRENGEFTVYDGAGDFRLVLDPKDTLTWSFSRYTQFHSNEPTGLTQAAYDRDPDQSLRPDSHVRFWSNLGTVTFTRVIDPTTTFEVIGWYRDGFRGRYEFRPIVPPLASDRVQQSTFSSGALEARYSWTTEIGGVPNSFFHSARYLIESNREFYFDRPFGSPITEPHILDDIIKGRALSLYNEDTIGVARNVDLTLGARVEGITMISQTRDPALPPAQLSQVYNEFLPAASATWTPRPRTALYASVQRNFFSPQYETGFDPNSVLYAPSRPEHSIAKEVGARWREVQGLEVSTAVFQTDFSDKLDYVNTSSGYKQAVNTGEARSRGAEVGVTWDVGSRVQALRGLSAYGTYTRLRATQESGPNEGKDLPDAPRELASWGAEYEHRTGLWARIGGSYTGSAFKDADNTPVGSADGVHGPIPSVILWDASVGWKQHDDGTGLSIGAGVTNLLDRRYFRRFSQGIYPGAPRQVFVAAGYTLAW